MLIDLRTLIDNGDNIVEEYSNYLYDCKHKQAIWFGETDPVIIAYEKEIAMERESIEEGLENGSTKMEKKISLEWNPINEFKFKREEWVVRRKMS